MMFMLLTHPFTHTHSHIDDGKLPCRVPTLPSGANLGIDILLKDISTVDWLGSNHQSPN